MNGSYGILPLCYLIGSLPFGVIYGKVVKGVDIRQVGSGNIGASNILRIFGFKAFALVFLLDAGKGLGPVLLCRWIFRNDSHGDWFVLLGGLLSIIGHNWSVFLGFTGGRGVATGVGVVFGVAPVVALCGWALWGIVLAVSRYISLASIAAGILTPVLSFVVQCPKPCPLPFRVLITAAGILILIRHRPNFQRLLAGKEYKIGQKVAVPESSESDPHQEGAH